MPIYINKTNAAKIICPERAPNPRHPDLIGSVLTTELPRQPQRRELNVSYQGNTDYQKFAPGNFVKNTPLRDVVLVLASRPKLEPHHKPERPKMAHLWRKPNPHLTEVTLHRPFCFGKFVENRAL